ncbi:MAG: RHS repeat-associated core domain-containing protein, partial [Blastocatellia bacterium]
MTDPSGTTKYSYDSRDRLTSKATPEGSLTYSYDNAGNVLSVQSSNANGVNTGYSYDKDERLSTVTDNASVVSGSTRPASGVTTYSYDAAGNLSGFLYPNSVQTSYTYNTLNRLTNMTVAKVAAGGSGGSGGSGSGGSGTNLASYAYTLGPAGNRTQVQELSGRAVNYSYDDIYRLTAETISTDPTTANNGSISYAYDAVGNRQSRTSTIAAVPSVASSTYDADDRLSTDSYDANGSTTKSGANTYSYDAENHIVSVNPTSSNPITILYDGDGNRVAKTVGTGTSAVTTKYLVDDNNPTDYAQVAEEIANSNVSRTYTYGAMLISQTQLVGSAWTTSFYGSDGHGSIRFLTDSSGSVSDAYDYDAFGVLIHQTGSTPNVFLYSDEQFDPDLALYYQRARYLNAASGRFHTLDTSEGFIFRPKSLHKYGYAEGSPVNGTDPTGQFVDGAMGEVEALVESAELEEVEVEDYPAVKTALLLA